MWDFLGFFFFFGQIEFTAAAAAFITVFLDLFCLSNSRVVYCNSEGKRKKKKKKKTDVVVISFFIFFKDFLCINSGQSLLNFYG